MAVLEDCTNDTLLCIIDRIYQPTHLAHLSRVSRRLHQLVAPALANSKLYRSISFGCFKGRCSSRCLSTLSSILIRPFVASYALDVTIDLRCHCIATGEEALYSNVLEMATTCTGIRQLDDGASLVRVLEERSSPVAFLVLVFLLFPNLERLQVIVRGVNDSVDLSIPKAASLHFCQYLSEVSYTHWVDMVVPIGFHLEHLAPYFLLPSMKKISGCQVLHEGEFSWDGEYGTSTVTDLSFDYSDITLEALEKVLRIPRALKHFRYGLRCFPHLGDFDLLEWDFDDIFAVVKRTQSSLQDANIEIFQHRKECTRRYPCLCWKERNLVLRRRAEYRCLH